MSYCDKLRQRAVTSCDGLLRQNTDKRWRFHREAIDEWADSAKTHAYHEGGLRRSICERRDSGSVRNRAAESDCGRLKARSSRQCAPRPFWRTLHPRVLFPYAALRYDLSRPPRY